MSISDWILLFTLFAIIWYSIETLRLRRATVRATNLGFQPVLVVSQEGDNNDLFVTNVGRGSALNVECWYLAPGDDSPIDGKVARSDLLDVGVKRRLSELFLNENRETTNFGKVIEAQFDKRVSETHGLLVLGYSDISGIRYRAEFHDEGDNPVSLRKVRCLGRIG